jgi:OPA family glycerol-3-phosphate transporter-like MFS transporter
VGDADTPAARLRRWQAVTVGTLFVGYAGYYVCRSNLSVATPLLLEEYKDAGLTKEHIGDIASLGVLFYAIGKLINGVLADYLGGRRVFLFGLFGSVVCTLLFAYADRFAEPAGLAILGPMAVVWAANRFVQSMGWGGLVQIAGRWFTADRMATVMGVLSASYLLGDAAARAYLGVVIRAGYDWRGVFLFAAASLALIGLVATAALKQRPGTLGLPEPSPPPGNVYGNDRGDGRIPLRKLLGPLLGSFAFWLVCLMNAGLTLIRETFNLWNPTYLTEVASLSPGWAATASLVFPLVGALAGFLAGWTVDRARGRHGVVVIPALVGLTAVLLVMGRLPVASLPSEFRPLVVTGLTALVAFFLLAPYSFCSGVLAMKLGGQRGGATSAGVIDTAGYLGASLAGSGIGRVVTWYGWKTAFDALAGVTTLTLAVAIVYTVREGRKGSP